MRAEPWLPARVIEFFVLNGQTAIRRTVVSYSSVAAEVIIADCDALGTARQVHSPKEALICGNRRFFAKSLGSFRSLAPPNLCPHA
jgi:hypothetical protein